MHPCSSSVRAILPYLRRLRLRMPTTTTDVTRRVLAVISASERGQHSRPSSAPIILADLWRLQAPTPRSSKVSTDVLGRVPAIASSGVREENAFAFVIRSYHLAMASIPKTSTEVLCRVLVLFSQAFSKQGHVRPALWLTMIARGS